MAESADNNKSYELNADYFDCPVCSDSWLSKDPRVLPCQHTLCKECLGKLEHKECVGFDYIEDVINCPVCRLTVVWPERGIDGFPKNLVASNVTISKKLDQVNNLNCDKHGLEIIFVCCFCSNIPICRKCWKNHENHKLKVYEDYIKSKNFKDKCNEALEQFKQHFDKSYSNLALNDDRVEKIISRAIHQVKESCIQSRKKAIENINERLEILKQVANDKENWNSLKELEFGNKVLHSIQSELQESEHYSIKANNTEEMERKIINFATELFLAKEKTGSTGKILEYHNLLIQIEDLFRICREPKYPYKLFNFEDVREINRVKFPVVLCIHAMCYHMDNFNSLYLSVTTVYEKAIIWQLNSNNFEIMKTFRLDKIAQSIMIFKDEVYLCNCEAIVKLDETPILITRIENAVAAIAGDGNYFICITKHTIKKVVMDPLINQVIVIDIGPGIAPHLTQYKSICNWKNDFVIVLDGSFRGGKCIWIYDVDQNCRRSIFSCGKYRSPTINKEEPLFFENPLSICSINNDVAIVSDSGLKRLQIFINSMENKPKTYTLDFSPDLICFSPNKEEIYVSERRGNNILILSYKDFPTKTRND
ncbi:unnamed protein product [Dimorphilus gyrociliatus]|uniref:RING-type domain-containing protein n=1 Tax=Dimorphilus gyrociliatus TaxID=2664684 RepID=A0A7I8W9Q1_9ANNE|nr:unnamed protein product [Dimorphilus gyrociliatus]